MPWNGVGPSVILEIHGPPPPPPSQGPLISGSTQSSGVTLHMLHTTDEFQTPDLDLPTYLVVYPNEIVFWSLTTFIHLCGR